MRRAAQSLIAVTAAGVVVAGIGAGSTASADTYTFVGTNNDQWTNASNWSPNTGTPKSADTVVFSSSTKSNRLSSQLRSDFSIYGLSLTDPSGDISFDSGGGGGSYTLTLGAGGIDMSQATQNLTISSTQHPLSALVLGAAQAWNVAASKTLTIGSPVTNNANLLTIAGAGSTVISGAIGSGSGGLTKSGSGTLTLSGTNTYTGDTTISAGTLIVSSGSAIADTGLVSLANTAGAGLQLNSSEQIGALSGGGTTGGNVNLQGNTLTVGGSSTTTYAGVISGTGALTKSGTGTLTVSNDSSTYSGATTINNGVLNVAALANVNTNSSIGKGSSGGLAADLVLNGGTLQYTGSTAQTTNRLFSVGTNGGTIDASGSNNGNPLDFSGTGPMGFNSQTGTRTLTLTGTNTGANTLAATIGDNSGATAVTKSGTGTWQLSNTANTYSGVTTINNGVLNVAALGNVNANSSIGKGSSGGSAADLVLNGGTLQYTGSTAQTTNRLFSVGTNGGTIDASGSNNGNPLNFSGTGPMGFNSQTGARTLTLTGTNTGANTLAATIGDNSGATAVTKSGTGTWQLSNTANTYSGVTTINNGVLNVAALGNVNANSSIGKGSSGGSAADLVLNGGTLQYTGSASQSTNRLFSVGTGGGTIDASGSNNGNPLNFSGTGPMGFNSQTGARTLTLTGTNTGANTLAATIGDNSGATAVTKSGSGAWVLTGGNSYTGGTTIKNGSLQLTGGSNRLSSSGGVVLGDSAGSTTGKLILGNSSGTADQTLTSLTTAGSGGSVVGGNASASTLTLNIASGTNTFGGTLGGSGTNENNLALTKTGNGTLVLGGTNTYTGATQVNGGTLLVSGSTASGSAVTVTAGTLGGTGTIGGTVHVNNGGTVNPGSSATTPKTLAMGATTFGDTTAATTTLNIDMTNAGSYGTTGNDGNAGTDWDLLTMSTFAHNGLFTVNLSGTPAGMQSYTKGNPGGTQTYKWLIATVTSGGFSIGNQGTDWNLTFNGFNPLSGLTGSPTTSLSTSSGNLYVNYTYSAVPEATTLLLGMAGLAPVLMQRRGRRVQVA